MTGVERRSNVVQERIVLERDYRGNTAFGTVKEKILTGVPYWRKVTNFRSNDILLGSVVCSCARELLVDYVKGQIHFFFAGDGPQLKCWENGVFYNKPGILRVTHGRELLAFSPEGIKSFYFSINESFLKAKLSRAVWRKIDKTAWRLPGLVNIGAENYNVILSELSKLLSNSQSEDEIDTYLLDLICRIVDVDVEPEEPAVSPKLFKALSYIHVRNVANISVAEIAEFCNCTPRMLQYLFNEAFNMGPKQYCKLHIANELHAAIASSSKHMSLGEIAKRFNIGSLGRFSGDYFKLFGTYPINSLSRRT